jgi:molybdenum cofactor synthesis domain-containing protein
MDMVRLRGFTKLTPIDCAREQFFKLLKLEPLESEIIHVRECLGRILSTDIRAEKDIPFFDRSAVDGFAVRAEDTFSSSMTDPCVLEVIGKVRSGELCKLKLGKGEAVEVTTGAQLPIGADAVEMLEHVEKIDDKHLEIRSPVPPWKNVSKKGEDVAKGEIIIPKGTKLKPQHLGMLVALEYTKVSVFRRPRVAIFSTGDELIEVGDKLKPGKIIDLNRIILSNAVKEVGGEPVDLGIVSDNLRKIRGALRKGLKESDLVITSGGTSVGESDLVPEAVNSLGKPGVIVHGVRMRPGMPTALAILNGKPVILLSGYSVAAMMGFEFFAKPLILRMLCTGKDPDPIVKAALTRRVASSPGFKQFVRVLVKKVNEKYIAEPIQSIGSGILSSLIKANGLLIMPEDSEGVEEGEEVEIVLFGQVK